jgi:hypothetical protein
MHWKMTIGLDDSWKTHTIWVRTSKTKVKMPLLPILHVFHCCILNRIHLACFGLATEGSRVVVIEAIGKRYFTLEGKYKL